MKDTFGNRNTSEEQLLNDLSKVDLLVIDEIGVQTESRYEKVIINQIVDRRSSSKRPTGMLTNSNMEEMNKLVGERHGPHASRKQPMGKITGKATDRVSERILNRLGNNGEYCQAEHVILVKTTDIICAGLNE
jgi:DNA replication protein DnaC